MAQGAYPPPNAPGGFTPPPGGFTPPPGGYGPPGPGAHGGYPGGAVPGAPYGVDPRTGMPYSDKQKIVAGILQLALGSFGAGRFYTGHTGIAIAQIAVSWLTCGIGAIWPMIDGVMMLVGNVPDSDGRPLRD